MKLVINLQLYDNKNNYIKIAKKKIWSAFFFHRQYLLFGLKYKILRQYVATERHE